MLSRSERLLSMWQSDKNNLPLMVELVDELFRQGDWQTCAQVFDELPLSVQNSPEACAKNIELLFHQNQLDAALDKARQLCQLTENHPIALHYLALGFYLNGDIDSVLSLQDENALKDETKILIARGLYHKGELNKALTIVSPIQIPEAVGLAAMLYYDSNQLEKAAHCADMVLATNDNQMDALLAKASVLVNTQQVEAATPFIDRALQIQPKSGRALSVKGQTLLHGSELENAVSAFNLAVTYMPDHIGTWHLLAWSQLLSNQLLLAKQAFQNAMELDRNFADSHGGLAVIAALEGDLENAANMAKVALRLNPASYSGLYATSIIAEKHGKNDEAVEIIDGIFAMDSHIVGQTNRDLVNAVIAKRKNAQ